MTCQDDFAHPEGDVASGQKAPGDMTSEYFTNGQLVSCGRYSDCFLSEDAPSPSFRLLCRLNRLVMLKSFIQGDG